MSPREMELTSGFAVLTIPGPPGPFHIYAHNVTLMARSTVLCYNSYNSLAQVKNPPEGYNMILNELLYPGAQEKNLIDELLEPSDPTM